MCPLSSGEERLAELLVAVGSRLAELEFDLHEAVVLGDAVSAAEGAGLDLAAVGRDGNVGDGRVLGLTGTVVVVSSVSPERWEVTVV